ncbi:MAG TPA: NAD(P)-dependent alcohol dehydrogenase [Actinophytocola sp.]|uniref:NAD(P)-dependent alcohol dehydrogenase n=1 Tax=Actinophytocola sp. TaxID=1872138 RepID=UPI002DB8D424|nr:NAD(P)-dependent alcohol dehydrogenase [Actinophytocola sp.]HEU5472480.1 NAD(P)-dependent alcohol dehydrogenase [Actinophytocola sp.]
MKAIVQDRYGPPDVLRLDEVDRPVPRGNQVLVRVHAAAVNALDWHFMRGDPYLARIGLGFSGPRTKIRGVDFAGTVEATGPDATRFRPGEEVYGEAFGAFADYVCAPENVLDTKPANLTFPEAAAVPLAGNTALIGLRDLAELQPGQRVLINGASGGVGTFAVQIAKAYGAEVTAVCSHRNVELVESLGADRIIDYLREDFTRSAPPHDVVFDLVGNRSLTDLRRVLTPRGTLLLSGGGTSNGGSLVGPMGLGFKGKLLSSFVKQRVHVLFAKQATENLAALRELIESGKVRPVIDRSYPLREVPAAIRYLEDEHARAKVVIVVTES